MCFMQTESVLQTKNRSGPAKNQFSVALLVSKEQASMETSLSHYNSLSVRIWPKLELVQDFMHVFVTCKFIEDQINSNRENVETSIF